MRAVTDDWVAECVKHFESTGGVLGWLPKCDGRLCKNNRFGLVDFEGYRRTLEMLEGLLI
jgi:hypothetical protein